MIELIGQALIHHFFWRILIAFAFFPIFLTLLTSSRIAMSAATVTARKDDATAAVQAATTNVAGWDPSSGGGGLIQTTSG